MAIPMTADLLLKALREEGLTVVEVGNWRTHNRNHKGPWGPVHGVMIHHTVTSGTDHSVQLCYGGHSDLPGPLCHGVIDKQGRVHLVGNGRTNHAGLGDDDVLTAVENESALPPDNEANTDGNRAFYGFECINLGDGNDPWPAAQLLAIEKVSAAICRVHGWSKRSVIGHLEWQPGKVDPRGFSMDSMRARIGARLDGNTTPPPQEEDMTLTKEQATQLAEIRELALDYHGKLPDGTRDPKDVYEYQRSTYRTVTRLEAAVAAQTAAIKALAGQLGEDVDTAQVVAAVQQAIADAVIKVDVDINSAPGA